MTLTSTVSRVPFAQGALGSAEAAAPLRHFANDGVVCEGWYAVGPARALRAGQIEPASIGDHPIVVYRERGGALRALDRFCAHLGADLTHGIVVDKGLQCAFHRWCWNGDGACVAGGGAAVGARIGTYHVRERWGLVWVWAGGTPAYDLPRPDRSNSAHLLRLPPQRLPCHAHVVLGNGLDVTHVVPVHRFRFETDPTVEAGHHRLSVTVQARFEPTPMRRMLGVAGRSAAWTFTNIGPSLAWVRVTSPTPFELVWAARPLAGGGCETHTVFFLPRWSALLRAVPMMIATTWADRRVLSGLRFRPGFVATDAAFARYTQLIESIPEWTAAGRCTS
jgi:phenylpropionate dioxygenase-like ring-hydroxylating dioxygenase large terminal subunit